MEITIQDIAEGWTGADLDTEAECLEAVDAVHVLRGHVEKWDSSGKRDVMLARLDHVVDDLMALAEERRVASVDHFTIQR